MTVTSVVLVFLLAGIMLASIFTYAFAQLADSDDLLSLNDPPNGPPGNGHDPPGNGSGTGNLTQQVPPPIVNGSGPPPNDNLTSPPPPPSPEPGGNESSSEPNPFVPPPPVASTDPCITFDEKSNMVHIKCDASIYDLFAGLRDDSITKQLGSGQILLKANVTVDQGATFTIDSSEGVNYLKIAGGNGITVHGAIHVDNIKITSWNATSNEVINQTLTGSVPRAFLFLSGSQGSRILNSELGFMGFNSTGHRGVDLLTNSSNFSATNSTFHNMWYGFFSNGGYNITISSSTYRDNEQYAIDPHTGTHNMTIANSTIYNNPEGLVCSLDCNNVVFEHNKIYNNTGAGIFFSRNTHHSIARYNTIYDNPVGITFSESSDNEAYGNNITSVGRGVFFTNPSVTDDGNTTNNKVYNNTISNSTVGVASFRTSGNIAADNHFENIKTAHYRLDGNSTMTIANQTFDNNTVIQGLAGQNTLDITNSSIVKSDNGTIYASTQYTITLSNQATTLSSVNQ